VKKLRAILPRNPRKKARAKSDNDSNTANGKGSPTNSWVFGSYPIKSFSDLISIVPCSSVGSVAKNLDQLVLQIGLRKSQQLAVAVVGFSCLISFNIKHATSHDKCSLLRIEQGFYT
ncbi:MAG: hypothetical protein ACTIJX_01990, partial [Oceanisphaera sp.]